ncbi:NAD(P)-dependent alcohol dehydrogenase [Lactobacillus sp. ESL0680]|uniref:NAD(P)-dependent alcohol dehydrogenase n=1 Tax=Lactobacillus sp. ESL0680 TaxID=2983210 RepID=UPI0023F73224|nr:NAD(P)-dependent alcohol dehydrogenase [Lactobacillus sp. ESL0680]WEV38715.1 NAD(P)-dependent alcohol dehydrogenase [Lactobacillus sp. ESL0680]
MKAIVYTQNGNLDALKIKDIPKPVPKKNQVLIHVKASTLNILDYQRFKNNKKIPLSIRIMNRMQGSIGRPLGADISGIVVGWGENVSKFKIGDEVFAKTLGTFPAGGWAEYAVVDKDQVGIKPQKLSFEQAAAIPTSFETALGSVRKAKVKKDQQVMIYGSSGGVGLFAVQIAKAMGAIVTGVCSTRNVQIAKTLGCDSVIDYKKENFTQSKQKFDAIIGVNGSNPISSYKKLLTDNGIFVGVGMHQIFKTMLNAPFSKHVDFFADPMFPQKDYLMVAQKLANEGKLDPYIDEIYQAKDIKQAINYVITKHPHGKVAVDMNFD